MYYIIKLFLFKAILLLFGILSNIIISRRENMDISKSVILVDCDGVLYSPNQLDINAMVYAFNQTCTDWGLNEAKLDYVEDCTRNKPVKGFFDYINYIADQTQIKFEDFCRQMVNNVDYSHLLPDTSGILPDLIEISHHCQLCLCTDNHPFHLDRILQARFGIALADLPFPNFNCLSFCENGNYYSKASSQAVEKLEKFFNSPATNFIWLDDSSRIAEKVRVCGCQCCLVTAEQPLTYHLNCIKKQIRGL